MNKLTFLSSDQATEWARTHAREHMYAHHFWKIVKEEKVFVVAILSKNTNQLHHYATAD